MALPSNLLRNCNYDPDHEFRINPTLNTVFHMVLRFELILLRPGLRFPAGGSLLLLALKP